MDTKTIGVGPKAAVGRRPRGARSSGLDRALQILDHLQEAMRPVSSYAIAKAIGAPLSTVYVVVDDLVEKRMLQRRGDGMVWLGARLYHYGLAYAGSLDFLDVATHAMQDLCREVGETVQICGRDGDHMVVLAMADGPGHFRITSRIGSRVPLNWTASGRLLVGHLPDAERLAVFRHAARVSPTGAAQMDAEVLSQAAARALVRPPVDPDQRVGFLRRVRRRPRSAIPRAPVLPRSRSCCPNTGCCRAVSATRARSWKRPRGSKSAWAGSDLTHRT